MITFLMVKHLVRETLWSWHVYYGKLKHFVKVRKNIVSMVNIQKVYFDGMQTLVSSVSCPAVHYDLHPMTFQCGIRTSLYEQTLTINCYCKLIAYECNA